MIIGTSILERWRLEKRRGLLANPTFFTKKIEPVLFHDFCEIHTPSSVKCKRGRSSHKLFFTSIFDSYLLSVSVIYCYLVLLTVCFNIVVGATIFSKFKVCNQVQYMRQIHGVLA